LRDRIEILENVVGAQTYDVNTEAWRDLLYPLASDDSTSQSEGDLEKVGK
jgi:head-tail adaptor